MAFRIRNEEAPALNPSTSIPVLPKLEAPGQSSIKQPSIVEGSAPSPASEVPKLEEDVKPLSPHYANLARKERALRRQLQDLKVREEAFKSRESQYQSDYVRKSDFAERMKKDPLGVMKDYGLSYDDIVRMQLQAPSPQDQIIADLKAELQAIRGETQATKDLISQQEKNSYDQALNQIRSEVQTLIKSDTNTYETIEQTGNVEAVVEFIRETFEKTGTILSVEEAAKEVEAYLTEEALKMLKLKKIQEKLKESSPAAVQAVTPQAKSLSNPRTLTHASTTSPSKGMTPRERAILAFEGKLP